MATRVFRYGLHAPKLEQQRVSDQLYAAHRYRNTLIKIELDRRDEARKLLAAHGDVEAIAAKIEPLIAELQKVQLEIKAKRAASRSRSEAPELRKAARALGAQLKTLRSEMKEIKQRVAADAEIQAKLAEIRERAKERQREARASCGCFWGTYLLIEQAHDAACKSVTPPRFARWSPHGNLGVLIMKGMDLADLFNGKSTQIQVRQVPDEAFTSPIRGVRRRLSRTSVRMRIASDDTGKPIWGEWDMVMHRPLPEGCRIKNVRINRTPLNSTQMRWSIHFTVELAEGWRSGKLGDGMVALNLGWHQKENGEVRSGFVVGDDGYTEEVVVPRKFIDRIEKCDSIQSYCDKNLDEMRPKLAEWMSMAKDKIAIPEWFTERTQHLHAWRSEERFAKLARHWKVNRFEGDQEGYELLEAWRYRYYHLDHYESGMRSHALGYRRELYRVLAAKLASQYDTLVIDDTNLMTFQRTPDVSSERIEMPAVKRNQRHAAGSELRAALINAFRRGGGKVIEVSAENVTRQCHACRELNDGGGSNNDSYIAISHVCSGCGRRWDRDENACRNLLRLAKQSQVTESQDVAPKEGRSQRFRAAKALRAVGSAVGSDAVTPQT